GGCAWCNFFDSRTLFACFMLNNGNRSRRDGRLVAVLCQRFAGKKDLFLGRTGHGGCGVARNLRTPTVVAARLSAAAIIVSTGFAALWRRVLRRRKIASAGTTLWSAAMASATTSPTAPAATIPASVTAAIPAPGERFAWKHFHGSTNSRGQRCHGSLRLLVRVPVIVVFEIFENIADIQESVAIQTDVHESGLHAWQNAGNFSFVDAADESELFFPLDVDFD